MKPFDLEDLPDSLSQSEAFWMLNSLSYAMALYGAYRRITTDPKAAHDWDRVVEAQKKGVRRIYPEAEARYLIALAEQKAREGVERQIDAMKGAENG